MAAIKAAWVCGLSLMGLAGCAAQADPDYQGEPLLTVNGKVTTGATAPTEAMDVAVLWEPRQTLSELNTTYTIARTRVDGSFPSAFTLEVFDPPPHADDPAYQGNVATGLIVAVPSDSPATTQTPETLGGVVGARVLYFPEDGDPDASVDVVGIAAWQYNVEPVKGFHLALAVMDGEQAEADFYRCTAPNKVCIHRSDQKNWSDLEQQFQDDELERCLKYIPDATTCTYELSPATAAEEAASASCWDLYVAQDDVVLQNYEAGLTCSLPYHYESLDGSGSKPLTVTLGVGEREIADPRLPL